MTLWRLEWLRLLRTHRLLVLVGLYLFFGLTGPLTARYLRQILDRLGTDGVRVEFPPPQPPDGIAQFVGNASQIGVLAAVLVAGSAMAFDARREMAVFLRTRVSSVRQIIIAAYALNTAAAAAAVIVGSSAAWYETAVLLGPLPIWPMAAGMAYGALFMAFVVAVTALMASLVRSTAATAGLTLAVLLSLALLASLGAWARWLPTTLSNALAGLTAGASPASYLPAAAVAMVSCVVCVTAAVVLSGRREL